jgi:hypothetical protein
MLSQARRQCEKGFMQGEKKILNEVSKTLNINQNINFTLNIAVSVLISIFLYGYPNTYMLPDEEKTNF